VNHPISLANLLWDEAHVHDAVVIAAALPHATLEDTRTTRAEVEAAFGAAIAAVVVELTDDKTLAKAERKRLQIEHAGSLSHRAKLVKLADKICNLREVADTPPTDWSPGRRCEYFDWAKAVVDGLRGTHAELERRFDEAYARRVEVERACEPA
jgi:guanosine-3',5'-bis(diphosphate) 3'-pyrophosphohydrolase